MAVNFATWSQLPGASEGSAMGEVAPDEPKETQVENPTESWDSAEKNRVDMAWCVMT